MTNAHNPNPQEQYDSARTARFRHTRTVQEIAGAPRVALNARYTSGNYPKLYNVSTGRPNELFAYGGYVSEEGGAFVARLDAETLVEIWRARCAFPITGTTRERWRCWTTATPTPSPATC